MKIFKQVDFALQLVLISGFTIASLVKQDYTFLIAYFVVGLCQLISMVVHAANKWHFSKRSPRYNYSLFVVCLLAVTLLALAVHLLIFILFLLLFAAPVLAVYYTSICYREVFYYQKRPLELI